MSSEDKTCPDCPGAMKAIHIIDKTMRGNFPQHKDLEYTVAESNRSIWTGLFPIDGTIAAFMCDRCGRVLLYGQPRVVAATGGAAVD